MVFLKVCILRVCVCVLARPTKYPAFGRLEYTQISFTNGNETLIVENTLTRRETV